MPKTSGTGTEPGKNGGGAGSEEKEELLGEDAGGVGGREEKEEKREEKHVSLTQEQIDKLVGGAREEGRKSEEKKREREKAEAEAEARKQQGQFQKLYEDLDIEHRSLQARFEEAERRLSAYSELANRVLDAQIAEWPSSLKKLDPGKEDVEGRMRWVEKSQDLAKELLRSQGTIEGEHGRRGALGGAATRASGSGEEEKGKGEARKGLDVAIGSLYRDPRQKNPATRE